MNFQGMNIRYVLETMTELADNNNKYIDFLHKIIKRLTQEKIDLEEKLKLLGNSIETINPLTNDIKNKPKRQYNKSGKYRKN